MSKPVLLFNGKLTIYHSSHDDTFDKAVQIFTTTEKDRWFLIIYECDVSDEDLLVACIHGVLRQYDEIDSEKLKVCAYTGKPTVEGNSEDEAKTVHFEIDKDNIPVITKVEG